MHVGLDALPLTEPKTGIGHYTSELRNALASTFPLDDFQFVSPYPIQSTEKTVVSAPRIKGARRFWWLLGLPLYLRQAPLNLFHGTNYEVPLWSKCPTVVSIHDLSLLLHPETHEDRLVRRARYRLPLMARVATRIVTGTHFIKNQITQYLKLDAHKIFVTPYGARTSFHRVSPDISNEVRRRLRVEDLFLLFVGTLEPRKNLMTLLKAFEEVLSHTDLSPQLVIAGKEGWLMSETREYIEQARLADRIRVTGYVSDDELRALYSSCTALVYPSTYEGFGLPPLEAMACGAPVVASKIESIAEVTGNAACLFPPTDHRELASLIIGLVRDEKKREHFSEVGLARSRDFTWERTARMTMDVYREALKSSG
jgi:glycosyltransferase involved in cell wall biosynthesis